MPPVNVDNTSAKAKKSKQGPPDLNLLARERVTKYQTLLPSSGNITLVLSSDNDLFKYF